MTGESPRNDSAELAALIAQALRMADALHMSDVGISLDRALAILTGEGIPPESAGDLGDLYEELKKQA